MLIRRALSLVLLVLSAAPVSAQQRTIPPATAPGPFAASRVEHGVPGDYVILPLQDTLAQVPSIVKRYADLLFYDPTQPGPSLLVVSVINPYGAGAVLDCYQWVWLPPGLRLTAAHLDHDLRQDVIGYHPATGEIYRWYRRGSQTAGCW